MKDKLVVDIIDCSSYCIVNIHADSVSEPKTNGGSMIPLSVSEISTLDGFCEEEQEQEWGILVVLTTRIPHS